MGAIDDNPNDANSVSRKHLQAAIDDIVAGREVSVKESDPVGCTIKRVEIKDFLYWKEPRLVRGFFYFRYGMQDTRFTIPHPVSRIAHPHKSFSQPHMESPNHSIPTMHTNFVTQIPAYVIPTNPEPYHHLRIFGTGVGFCLAKAISKQSTLGIILALVSLAAVVTFLFIAAKAKTDFETAKEKKNSIIEENHSTSTDPAVCKGYVRQSFSQRPAREPLVYSPHW